MTTMDNLSDKLLSKVFRNLVDLTDFRNCRLVSRKWRRTVLEACRSKFHIVFPLTDSTLYTAHKLKDALVSFDIYSFTGKGKNDTWATSGIATLLQTTPWLHFSGSELSREEIRKILGLAHDSLRTLSFKCIKKDLARPFLKMQETFSALRKLSLGYHSIEKDNDTFTSFTKTLEKWNSLDCRVQLPLLESLNLYFDCRAGYHGPGYHTPGSESFLPEDLFRNYVAIAKLLLKYKQTMREIQIDMIIGGCYLYLFPHMVQPEWKELERGFEALNELNLNRLKLTTTPAYTTNGYSIAIEVLGRPKNLKNVLYNNLVCPYRSWCLLMATLSSFNNVDSCYLTSIKISIFLRDTPDPTLAINLGGFKECRNLRTLWLKINKGNRLAQLAVRNVELLPKGISILRFEVADKRYKKDKEILVNQQQIRWIIDNLRELESFWMSLVIPEQTNANENNDQREDAGVDNDEDDNGQFQQEENVIRVANINVDTFRDLIAMPKLKDIKVDMINARALSLLARTWPWQLVEGQGTTLDDIREYSDLCEAAGGITTTSPSFGVNDFYGYATLTIQRNRNRN